MMNLLTKLWLLFHFSKKIQLAIIRFFHDEFLVGVAGIIFNEKGEVLLFKHTYRELEWGLPGGYLKAKEHPLEGLEREIEEESGFVVAIDEPLSIKTDRETARLEVCYVGTFIGGEFKKSDEVSSAAFFSFDSLPLIPRKQLFLIDMALRKRKRLSGNKFKSENRWKFMDRFRQTQN